MDVTHAVAIRPSPAAGPPINCSQAWTEMQQAICDACDAAMRLRPGARRPIVVRPGPKCSRQVVLPAENWPYEKLV